jgi:hypothetical protein
MRNAPRRTSRDLGIRSFGSFGKGPQGRTTANASRSRQGAGRIYNYPLKREVPEK